MARNGVCMGALLPALTVVAHTPMWRGDLGPGGAWGFWPVSASTADVAVSHLTLSSCRHVPVFEFHECDLGIPARGNHQRSKTGDPSSRQACYPGLVTKQEYYIHMS
ncbi:hypothetical protein BD779DRAFT_1505058 [Infundibulicybe gibba]|nr:hypothetical protein BD779DRAFT_1505058 [Infundibulicybe gibba]